MKKLLLLLIIFALNAEAHDKGDKKCAVKAICGKVVDPSGEAVPGTCIVIAETGQKAYSDFQGNFSIEVPLASVYHIQVNGPGFAPLEIPADRIRLFGSLTLKPL